MATIARLHMPLKAWQVPTASFFSRSCLGPSTISIQKYISGQTQIPTQGRWSAKSFSVSATVQEKKYTKDHEWIELSEDGKLGTIGITKYAASALGDVVYIELPQTGQEVSSGDTIGAVESVKSASDILTPVSGKIVSANETLEAKPGIINQGPEDEGWIAKIEITGDVSQEGDDGLMDEEGYRKFTEVEG